MPPEKGHWILEIHLVDRGQVLRETADGVTRREDGEVKLFDAGGIRMSSAAMWDNCARRRSDVTPTETKLL
jgi:hypothetical protein